MNDVQDPRSYPAYLTGMYLAVNAIRDVYLVVDGPNCAFFRIPQIQPNHDWLADLARSSGVHRVVDTDATPSRVAQGNPTVLLERIRQVDGLGDCAVILLTPMTHVAITGRQYAPLLDGLDPPLIHPVIQVVSDSLAGDWLDGYANTLAALARDLVLEDDPGPTPTPGGGRVALVGHMLHRLEADATADLDELLRMITGLDLEVVSAWPSGGDVAQLAAARQADTVVSLPYAREAGRVLAARTGATLVELDLPLGLEGSSEFLRQLGEATDRVTQAEAFVESELRRVVPRLEWVLAHELQGRRVLTAGDPHLVSGLRSALTELGCTVGRELVYARSEHGATPSTSQSMDASDPPPHHVAPSIQHLTGASDDQQLCKDIDLGVVCSLAVDLLQDHNHHVPFVEVGFPSYYSHALYPQPTLGFDGTLCLVSRLVTALRHWHARQR